MRKYGTLFSQKARAVCAVFLLCMTALPLSATPAEAPRLSARVFPTGGEIEAQIGAVGLMYSLFPKRIRMEDPIYGVCDAEWDTHYISGRYFFEPASDGWYLGLASVQNKMVSGNDACIYDVQESQGTFLAGYRWLWDSGFNVDIGIRPGFLAIGFSF
ncbi:MAG: hypothetical protein OEZ59_02425 [Deltaproteobacteria bacterium]|nr:hypothetical protein [Deltaproteobacteria bacterium]